MMNLKRARAAARPPAASERANRDDHGGATAALMLAFPFTVNSKLAYASALIGLIFALGGSMVMFITANAQIFGVRKAGEIYSLLFSAISLASLVGAKLTMRLLAPLGWSGGDSDRYLPSLLYGCVHRTSMSSSPSRQAA